MYIDRKRQTESHHHDNIAHPSRASNSGAAKISSGRLYLRE